MTSSKDTILVLETFGILNGVSGQQTNQALDEFSLRPLRIEYDQYSQVIRRIASLHRRAVFNEYGGGLLLTADTGTGKSSALKQYAGNFPLRHEVEGVICPVLFVETPSDPTVKNLAEAILSAMGDPASVRGTAEQKTRRIYKFFASCKVELLLIDEFHHFVEVNRRTVKRDVTDWLKNLLNVTRVGVVLAGLPSSEEALRCNQQLARRFSARLHLAPFTYFTDKKQLEFRGLLQCLQKQLPVECIDLHTDEVARRIFMATNGVIDYVIKLLEEACDLIRNGDFKFLDLSALSKAFTRSIWAEAPAELNPFIEEGILRPLTMRNEPFFHATQTRVNPLTSTTPLQND